MIAALIATLREFAKSGRSCSWQAATRIVETLKITGLDQVFEVVAPGDPRASGGGKPPEPRRPGQRTRARFATFVLGALVALSGAAAASAQFHGPSDGSIAVSDAR